MLAEHPVRVFQRLYGSASCGACLGRARAALVRLERTLFRCATPAALARFELVDLPAADSFVLTQGTLFAHAAACGVNQRVEHVLGVLGQLWCIWSGRRSGELRCFSSRQNSQSMVGAKLSSKFK